MLIDDLKNGESDQLEFKLVPNRDSSKWLKTVVAFANGRGGRIVFGVSNDRHIVGLEGDLFAMKDGIADAIADACSPSVLFELCEWPNAVRTVIFRPLPPNRGGNNGGNGMRQERSARIVELMRKNPKISVSAIVSAIGGGKRSVEREIAALKAAGCIDRKGTYAGEWIVLDA